MPAASVSKIIREPYARAAQPAPVAPIGAADPRRLTLRLVRPALTTTMIEVDGELDLATAPVFAEFVAPYLTSAHRLLIINLAAVTFLGVAGLAVLTDVRERTRATGQAFRLIGGPRCVDRALSVGGLDQHVALN